jgi:hypothetical protein
MPSINSGTGPIRRATDLDLGVQLRIQSIDERPPGAIAQRLFAWIEFLQLAREQFDDFREALPGRGHRLDDVAGVARVVVSVIRHELAAA